MSTLRTTTLKHGSSTIDNIVFDNQGRSTFGNDALFVNAQNQRVGVNTTSPSVALDVDGAINATGNVVFSGQLTLTGDLAVDTNTLFVDATNNRVGIGTTAPFSKLHVASDGQTVISIGNETSNTDGVKRSYIKKEANNDLGIFATGSGSTNANTVFYRGNTAESMRIDSAGRLLVGTDTSVATGSSTGGLQLHNTTSASGAHLSVARFNNDSTGGKLVLGKSRSTTVAAGTIVQDNDAVGIIEFAADDGTDMSSRIAEIHARVDGTPGSNDTPGRLEFRTTADGASTPTERMRISNNGNIGLNSPAANLNDNITIGAIVNDVVTQRYITIRGKSTDSATIVSGFACLQWSGENSEVPYTTDSVTAYSAQSYTPGTNQTLTNLYGFSVSAGLNLATNNYGFHSNLAAGTGRWNFYANGTAANYFAGRAGVGTEASNLVSVDDEGVVLQPSGQIYINPGTNQACIEARRNNDGFLARFFNNSTTPCGDITVTGQTTAFNTSSDYRLKENITPIVDAADRVKALKPCRFNFIADASKTVDGFLAHEAQEVVPEAVTGTKDGEEMQAIDTSKLVPLLTAALQEALERIKVLEQRVLE